VIELVNPNDARAVPNMDNVAALYDLMTPRSGRVQGQKNGADCSRRRSIMRP